MHRFSFLHCKDQFGVSCVITKLPLALDTHYGKENSCIMSQSCQSTSPIPFSSIIFSSSSNSLSKTLSSLKQSTLSITNRLTSISRDAEFVQSIAEECTLPLIANERCGSWYIPPAQKAGSAYFKSTDGHFGEWKFSTRRLNLGLLSIVERGNG